MKRDRRIECPFCGTKTWMTDYVRFMRASGVRCLQARKAQDRCAHGECSQHWIDTGRIECIRDASET